MNASQQDRLSNLYLDAHRALAEASEILEGIGGRAGLSTGTDAALNLAAYLCEEVEQFAPGARRLAHSLSDLADSIDPGHSVKA